MDFQPTAKDVGVPARRSYIEISRQGRKIRSESSWLHLSRWQEGTKTVIRRVSRYSPDKLRNKYHAVFASKYLLSDGLPAFVGYSD